MAVPFMQEMEQSKKANEAKIESILAEYHKAKHLPRKKKKQRMKELNLEYSIFAWAREQFYQF